MRLPGPARVGRRRCRRCGCDWIWPTTAPGSTAGPASPDCARCRARSRRRLTVLLRASAPVRLACAGRTDAGVHARGQVAHADVPADLWDALSARGPEARVRRLAGRAGRRRPGARSVRPAPAGFDARWSALSRTYAYRVSDLPGGADPLLRSHVLHAHRPAQRPARRRRHERRGGGAARRARLRRVLPAAGGGEHGAHAARRCAGSGRPTPDSRSCGSGPTRSATRWCAPSSERSCPWATGRRPVAWPAEHPGRPRARAGRRRRAGRSVSASSTSSTRPTTTLPRRHSAPGGSAGPDSG